MADSTTLPAEQFQPIQLLHHFFERSVALHPDKIAVDIPPDSDGRKRQVVSYRQLNTEADSLAARIALYSKLGKLIAILLPRNSHRLYLCQLAVLKSGAAFTCIDPVFPDSHIQAVLDNADASLLLTDVDGLSRVARAGLQVPHAVDVGTTEMLTEQQGSQPQHETPTSEDLCYVIYTSGTTGAPKGVMIEHRSVVNLVASDIEEFQLTPADRVGQGSSAAYDSSIEEIWLAFASGATLVVIDDTAGRMGPDLVDWLRRERITVFCPPPTLLRTTGCMDPKNELPDLRLLYVGGEALTEDLVERWAPGRRLVNGYGPTECTVTVLRADVRQGFPVTIGRPVQGHSAWVLDPNMSPMADGEPGELCIAGRGLARGYRNLPKLTNEKFPIHPTLGRIYRTGDLVTREADGQFNYLGRIDTQIKLRGYRVELEAIEAHLSDLPGVRECACRVQGEDIKQLLAAHIVPIDLNAPPDFVRLKTALRGLLPSYMVPARFGLIETLPRSIGGKVDRKQLPELLQEDSADPSAPPREIVSPCNALEAYIVEAFGKALGTNAAISTDDDFFIDLGGDSLTAVAVTCFLRQRPETASATTRDLYNSRCPARLAQHLLADHSQPSVSPPFGPLPPGHNASPIAITILQTLWLLLQLIAMSAVGHALAFEFLPSLLSQIGLLGTLLLEPFFALFGTVIYTLCSIGITVGLKWVLIGRYESMRTPVWSIYYLRHWIVANAARTIPWDILAGTALYGSVLRALGAKVGRRVHVHRGVNLQVGGWDMLTIGDDVTLACEANIGLVELHNGSMYFAPVAIGDGATVDIRACLSGNTSIERDGYLTALSWLPTGETISAGEMWDGVPAVRMGESPVPPTPVVSKTLTPSLYTFARLGFDSIASIAAMIPLLIAILLAILVFELKSETLLEWLSEPKLTLGPFLLMLVASIVYVPIALLGKAIFLRCLGQVQPGTLNRWSVSYIRMAYKSNQVESVGRWLSGTLFWPIWLRLAGMNIGAKCEISSIIGSVPETLRVGEESFLADGIYLGGPRIHRGTVTMEQTSLERGTFLGNHVVIPTGSKIQADVLIGVCTVVSSLGANAGTSWFGHPPLELPRREIVHMDRSLTYEPGILRFTSRLFWETLRFALPIIPLSLVYFWYWLLSNFALDANWVERAFLLAPTVTLATIVVECGLVVAMKWFLLGRAKAGQHPLWSCWCSRWDFLYVAWQFYAVRFLVSLEGTLWLAMYLRAMGASIGRRVVLGPGFVQLADPDMIIIEDHATVCANYQAHSFEDRVLKLAPVVVRKGATVGESTVLFYGADVAAGTWVAPNSVVMKNELLDTNKSYGGCPVQVLDTLSASAKQFVSEDTRATALQMEKKSRYDSLDIARGLAVVGMIYMHFVPAETEHGGISLIASELAIFLEGKSAALFCLLAGMTWELQSTRVSPQAPAMASPYACGTGWYLFRRALTLAVAGVVLHVYVWPTEILVPLALMMLIATLLVPNKTRARLLTAALCIALIPIVPMYLGHYIETDWNVDGGHLADSKFGWVTLRYLLFDGNYPLVPWLAFPLLGMVMMAKHRDGTRPMRVWFAPSLAIAVLLQLYAIWVRANMDALEALTPYLASTWLPTTVPFLLTAGSGALVVVSGASWLWGAPRPTESSAPFRWLGLLGRTSLTHYFLHLCLVYVPLTALLGNDDWSVAIGLLAFASYLAIAIPLTVLWFRRNRRGPVEAIWSFFSKPDNPIQAKI
jgi:non-ribosomal peptide synthetase-like protein